MLNSRNLYTKDAEIEKVTTGIIKKLFRGFVILRFAGFIILLLAGVSIQAQKVTVKASADKNKILLGEPFWLTLEIRLPQSGVIAPFKVDTIHHFEIITKDSTQTLKGGDTTVIRQYFQLTSFDSGRWVIPPFTLRPYVKTNSVLMDVVFTENFDPNQPYHDVQDIRGVSFKLNKTVEDWWYFLWALLILLVLIIYWLTGEKRPKRKKYIPPEGAYKKAMRSLKELKQKKPAAIPYYTQLVEIFRTYIRESTGIDSLQQTSNDLVIKLKPLYRDAIKYDSMAQVLYLSDFVKFAKYNPDVNETASAYEVTEQSVKYLEEEMRSSKAGRG